MILKIENAAYGGFGVGRYDGKTVFVKYTLPGDIVEAEIISDKSSYSFADCVKIAEPSPHRIEPLCPNFTICGGCSYLNTDYNYELEIKRSILVDQLKRIALINYESEIEIISSDRMHYRSHSSIKYDGTKSGFYAANSNMLVEFPAGGCMIISETLTRGLENIQVDIKGELKVAENCRGEFVYKEGEIEESVGDFIYRRDLNGFFQSNKYLRGNMIEQVINLSGLTGDDDFVDICAGCGFFTIPLSKKAKSGTGFDIDKKSIYLAKKNSRLNNSKNLEFYRLSESEINPYRFKPKTVVVDPPRSGISKRGRRTINAISPEIIVYVSCNPSTFSRDLKDFIKNGYEIEKIILIDMFPATHHIEIISRLVRK